MKCSIIPCTGLCRHDSPFHLCEACYVERRRNGDQQNEKKIDRM